MIDLTADAARMKFIADSIAERVKRLAVDRGDITFDAAGAYDKPRIVWELLPWSVAHSECHNDALLSLVSQSLVGKIPPAASILKSPDNMSEVSKDCPSAISTKSGFALRVMRYYDISTDNIAILIELGIAA